MTEAAELLSPGSRIRGLLLHQKMGHDINITDKIQQIKPTNALLFLSYVH
jgi:hypothetical protein